MAFQHVPRVAPAAGKVMSSGLTPREGQANQPSKPADPAGFAQRGAIVPFTTPNLLGARLRLGAGTGSLEFGLPSLGGSSEGKIIPGNALEQTEGLTLHDRALWRKLQSTALITPERVRTAAQEIAREGLRGRAAMDLAMEQTSIDTTSLRRMFFLLLTNLIRRTEMPAENTVPPEQESLTYLRPRIGRAIGRIARRFNTQTEDVEVALEALASAFTPLGKAGDTVSGHRRLALADLRAFVKELGTWTAPRVGSPRGTRAEWILRKAAISLSCAEAAITELDRVMDDTTILINAWQRDQQSVLSRVARSEWLLDGWDIVIALWRQSEPSDREAILWEMTQLVPQLPKEVENWSGFPKGGSELRLAPSTPGQGMDWRQQRPLEYIARNEVLLAGQHAATLATEAQKLREAYMVQSTRALTQDAGRKHEGEDALTRISGSASNASDSVLRQVVAVLDAVPSRSMLDPIIAAARPRLKLLRPPRPITFARILFLPFDGALIERDEWSAGSAKFPRAAITPLADAIRAAMGPAAEEISANLGGRNFFDVLLVDQAGRRLWAEAARLAPGLAFPEGLPSLGLSAAQCAELIRLATSIWRHAEPIWEAKLAAFSGPSPELVTAALKGPAQESQAAFSLALVSVMQKAQSPASVIRTATRLSPIAGSIADGKIDELTKAPPSSLPIQDPVRAAHMAEEYVSLLKELESAPPGRQLDRRSVIGPLLSQIGKVIEDAARQIAERQLLPALQNPNGKRRAAIVVNIEHLARALRRLEIAGRRSGNTQGFDELERAYRQRLKAIFNALDGGGLQRADVIRLSEILLGPEKSLELTGPSSKAKR
jgi:hypothetical protein